jgi:hypothetical protein
MANLNGKQKKQHLKDTIEVLILNHIVELDFVSEDVDEEYKLCVVYHIFSMNLI